MKSFWITAILVGFITMAGFWRLPVTASDPVVVQHVQFGSNLTLGCNISYLYDTTWFKHSPGFTPTVVLCANLRDGQPNLGFQLGTRFSVILMNRSFALRITDVEEGDLGLYYCIASVNTRLLVGSGTELQVSSPGSYRFVFYRWDCVIVGSWLLIMMLAVCITHWRSRSKRKTAVTARTYRTTYNNT